MARRRKKKFWSDLGYPKLPNLPKIEVDDDTKKSILIVILFAIGAVSILSVFGLAGTMGEYLMNALGTVLGWGKYFFPLAIILFGYFLYNDDKYELKASNYLGLFFFTISFLTLLHIFVGQDMWAEAVELKTGGGYLGNLFINFFNNIMGFWATLLLDICLLLVSLMLLLNTTLVGLIGRDSWFGKLMSPFNYLISKLFTKRNDDEEEEEEEEKEDEDDEDEKEEDEDEEKEDDEEEEEDDSEGDHDDENDEDGGEEEKEEEEPEFMKRPVKAEKANLDVWWKPTGLKIKLALDLMSQKKGKPASGDIKNNMEIIKYTLEKFGIPVEMGEVAVGPTVTQYTFRPAEGVKLAKITTLSNDLALALAAHPIRIEAPIPGKSLVGIEVPNQTKAMVGLNEILTSKDYKEKKSNLMIALGKDVAGKCWLYDVAKMPHLLVAGATNSGKSVCLNAIIISLIYQNNPDDIRFIMVDPKRVELPIYNGIPYLLTPVITDVPKTINALKWCLNEMDRRLDILSLKHKRNIQTYNETAKIKMPYIVFIIDELADLMVVAAKDVEAGIIRLAQMARAVGIHLVLATQRPSVDVITGLVKANMPARIAFSVASGIDSRTILDNLGAEKLLGRGDMLFTTAELSKPKRIQGAFVSELELKKIIRSIKDQGGDPAYLEGVTEKQKVKGIGSFGMNGTSAGDAGDGDEDELLEEAKEIIINDGKASASYLQRRLRIGYARAASILDQLESLGIMGPANGAKPRDILISKAQYEALINQGVSGMPLHNRDEAKAPEEFLEDDEEEEENEDDEDNEEDNEDENSEDENEEEENDDENDEENVEEEEDNEEEVESKKPVKPKVKNSKKKSDDFDYENDEKEDEDGDGMDDNVERIIEEDEEDQPKNKKVYRDKDNFDKFFSR